MTKEEAIKIIDCYDIGFYDLSGEKIPADKLAEAFDMAVEALQRTPNAYPTHECVKPTHECVDLISRQAAIDATKTVMKDTLDSLPTRLEDGEEVYDVRTSELDLILGINKALQNATKSLPSEEPKIGRWIDSEIPLEGGGAMPIQVCNQCSTFYPLAHTGGGYHFCPNCGADMGGKKNE